jgi:hypothetical protein
MALQEAWPMNATVRKKALKRLEADVSNPATRPRAFHAAFRALLSLSRTNLAVVETTIKARQAEELLAEFEQLKADVEQIKGAKP